MLAKLRRPASQRCPSCRRHADTAPIRCSIVIDPRTRPCLRARTPSLHSSAVCSPAGQRRSCTIRPLNSSTDSTASSCDEVVHVAPQQRVRVKRVLHGGMQRQLLGVEQVAAAESRARRRSTPAGVSSTFVPADSTVKCRPGSSSRTDAIGAECGSRPLGRAAGDHERNPRFVDQDRIRFVDDRGGEGPVDLFAQDRARGRRAASRSRPRWRSRT